MKYLIVLLLFTITSMSVAQKEKFETDLDTLFLKNGDVHIGRVSLKGEEVTYYPDYDSNKGGKEIKMGDIERITTGYTAHYKKSIQRWIKKGAPESIAEPKIWKILTSKEGDLFYVQEIFKGKNYNFYKKTERILDGNGEVRYVNFMWITKADSTQAIGWYKWRDKKETLERILVLFPNCEGIKDILEKKIYKKDDFKYKQVYNLMDNCDFVSKE
ncbi:MAG: hypothetical protein R2797_03355 [Gelidibacter sp.]